MEEGDDIREIEVTPARAAGLTQSYYGKRSYYGKSWALAIGINDYREPMGRLYNARRDTEAFAALLRQQHDFQVHTLIDTEATGEAILGWLRDELPRKTATDDRVVLFFAGHGVTKRDPHNDDAIVAGYLVPFLPEGAESGYANYIDMAELRTACYTMPAKHVLVVLDCCFSGVASVTTRAAPTESPRTMNDLYLKRVTQRPAYQVFTAGASDELAADSGVRPGHSAFTAALLDGLEGRADLDKDGVITAGSLAEYVAPRVSRETSHAGGQGQTPVLRFLQGGAQGNFVFFVPQDADVAQNDDLPSEDGPSKSRKDPQRVRERISRAAMVVTGGLTMLSIGVVLLGPLGLVHPSDSTSALPAIVLGAEGFLSSWRLAYRDTANG